MQTKKLRCKYWIFQSASFTCLKTLLAESSEIVHLSGVLTRLYSIKFFAFLIKLMTKRSENASTSITRLQIKVYEIGNFEFDAKIWIFFLSNNFEKFSSFFLFISQDYNDPCPYSLSPVTIKSQKLLRSPRKATRKISRIPFKVLDAPELQDDFYLNLVDWSAQNVLAVGLGSCVYLWSACTSQVSSIRITSGLITCPCMTFMLNLWFNVAVPIAVRQKNIFFADKKSFFLSFFRWRDCAIWATTVTRWHRCRGASGAISWRWEHIMDM